LALAENMLGTGYLVPSTEHIKTHGCKKNTYPPSISNMFFNYATTLR